MVPSRNAVSNNKKTAETTFWPKCQNARVTWRLFLSTHSDFIFFQHFSSALSYLCICFGIFCFGAKCFRYSFLLRSVGEPIRIVFKWASSKYWHSINRMRLFSRFHSPSHALCFCPPVYVVRLFDCLCLCGCGCGCTICVWMSVSVANNKTNICVPAFGLRGGKWHGMIVFSAMGRKKRRVVLNANIYKKLTAYTN